MTRPTQLHNIGRRRAWVIWGVGVTVYVLAIFYRTSLGVAGILAAERFHINASQLATFTVLQLGVYAAMQVPVGVLLDRYGARLLLTMGSALLVAGMTWFAWSHTYAEGLAARALLGVGDAMIFSAVIRLVALWFTVKQAPLVTQLTGVAGQLGAIGAAAPLSVALQGWGWERAFGVAALIGVVAAMPMLVLVKDSPYRKIPAQRIKIRRLATTMGELWVNPGTQVALYSHFTLPFATTVFCLLWGYPYLVLGQGMSPDGAANILMGMTATAIVAGPLVARFTARQPWHRSSFVLVLVGVIASAWAVLLLWPGRAPLAVIVVVSVITAVGGPGSMVSFDMARTFHPPERLSRASGIVNVGGFVAALAAMALIGLVLDWLAPQGPSSYTLDDFRIALSVQYLFWGFGAVQIWRYRRQGRQLLAETPGAVKALREGSALVPGLSLPPAGPRDPGQSS